jgi:hypothetical protein
MLYKKLVLYNMVLYNTLLLNMLCIMKVLYDMSHVTLLYNIL